MKSPSILFIFLFLTFLVPTASAAIDETFQYNKEFDLKRACFDEGEFCGSTFECNITILYPDGKTLINNKVLTNQVSFRNITISQFQNSQLGFMKAIQSCTNGTSAGGETFDIAITADGRDFQNIPLQFVIVLLAFALIGAGYSSERLRMFKHMGSIIILIMGVLTLYPGYSFINWTTLLGKTLGFIFIAIGGYFFIEDSFSRDTQEDNYMSRNREFYEGDQ